MRPRGGSICGPKPGERPDAECRDAILVSDRYYNCYSYPHAQPYSYRRTLSNQHCDADEHAYTDADGYSFSVTDVDCHSLTVAHLFCHAYTDSSNAHSPANPDARPQR